MNRKPLQFTTARAAIASGAVMLMATASLANADPTDDLKARQGSVNEEISQSETELAGINAELQKSYAELKQVEAQLTTARAELAAATERRAEAQRRDALITVKLNAATASEKIQKQNIEATTADIANATAMAGRLAASTYRGGPVKTELVAALAGDGDLVAMADRIALADSALRSHNASISRLGQQRASMNTLNVQLVALRAEIADLQRQSAAAVADAKTAEAEATQKQAQIATLVTAQNAATAKIEARRNQELAQIDQLKRESDALEAEMRRLAEAERRRAAAEAERRRASQAARDNAAKAGKPAPPVDNSDDDAPPPAASGGLLRPVGGPITSPYGYRLHPIYKIQKLHTGTDFGVDCGTPVKAAQSGKINKTGWAGGYGNQIVVNHGLVGNQILATSYNHLSAIKVSEGQTVSRGQVIGLVGTTGASTGCHLHFEVFADGTRVNPAGYL